MFPRTEYYHHFLNNFIDFSKEELWSEMLLGINKESGIWLSRSSAFNRATYLFDFVLYIFFFLNSDSCALPYMSFKRQSAKLAEEKVSQIWHVQTICIKR